MNRSFSTLILAATSAIATAQFPTLPTDSIVDRPDQWTNRIEAESLFDYNVNSLRNELPWALLEGGYISRDLRERSAEELQDRNSAGYDIKGRLTWTGNTCFIGLRHGRPMVSVAHRDVMGATFTEDVYRLTFFGNAAYEGMDADLGPSAFTRMRYQTLGFGITDARSNSYVRLDLVVGGSIIDVDVRSANLYTGVDGRLLSSSIEGEFHASDTAGSEFGRNNGLGGALSARWETTPKKGEKFRFAAAIDDFGFVQWNDNAVSLTKDTLLEFRGLVVTDLLDLDDLLIGEEQLRDTFDLHYRSGSFTTLLPFRANVEAYVQVNDRSRIGVLVSQRNLPGAIPEFVLLGDRRMGSSALLGASIAYGGFGGLRIGAGTRFNIGRLVQVSISTPHIPGFFLGPMRGFGLSFGAGVRF